MKNTFLKISVAMIAALFSQMAVAGDVLVQPATIQIRSLSSNIQLENLEATYSALCQYRSGIIFPESKYCGSVNLTVPVSADGTIRLPALEKVSGLHGRKTGNYRVSVSVHPKNQTPQDQEYFFTLSAYNEEAFRALENFRDVIYIGRLEGAALNITADRKTVLGGELSRLPNADLVITVNVKSENRGLQNPLLSNQFGNNIMSIYNRQNGNGTVDQNLLNARSVEIKGGNFAFIGNPADATISLNVTLYSTEKYDRKPLYEKTIVGKIDSSFLKDNRNIELEKVK
ncbi:MAG: hypothetical protein JSU04_05490 [Bdellovibrionales bacterium]|nr:hypothetical protein [Bdellovibrionales bacterium]